MKNSWKKNTALFLTSQTLSLFGTMLVQYAIMWHIVLETQSGAMMTIYILVAVLPTFFTSLIGGVWADRFNKKHFVRLYDACKPCHAVWNVVYRSTCQHRQHQLYFHWNRHSYGVFGNNVFRQ